LADPKKNPAARPATLPTIDKASFEKLRGASSARSEQFYTDRRRELAQVLRINGSGLEPGAGD
jgi:hypothetical protein